MAAGPRLQVEQVSTEDSSKLLNVVFDEESGSIAIDYSSYYERIATAIEEIAANTSNITNLANTTGIKTVSPYEWIELVSIYKYLIEDGTILQPASVTPAEVEEAKEKITEYLAKIKDLPTGTD
jgi:hypothetical protein